MNQSEDLFFFFRDHCNFGRKIAKLEIDSTSLEFCLPPTNIKREEVFAEFEILFAQLLHHKPKSIDELSLLKAKLNELAHSFCGFPTDVTKFPLILTVFKRLSLYVLINTF